MQPGQRTQGEWDTDTVGWLFVAQHQKRSLKEMGIFNAHIAAAEETDEDFFDNFS
jgi:hypothetical protein